MGAAVNENRSLEMTMKSHHVVPVLIELINDILGDLFSPTICYENSEVVALVFAKGLGGCGK